MVCFEGVIGDAEVVPQILDFGTEFIRQLRHFRPAGDVREKLNKAAKDHALISVTTTISYCYLKLLCLKRLVRFIPIPFTTEDLSTVGVSTPREAT